jgi:hypothetical protein
MVIECNEDLSDDQLSVLHKFPKLQIRSWCSSHGLLGCDTVYSNVLEDFGSSIFRKEYKVGA